jgi:hypothetical protein
MTRADKGKTMTRKTSAYAGFAAGILITLFVGALGSFIYTGKGLSDSGGPPSIVYPNL